MGRPLVSCLSTRAMGRAWTQVLETRKAKRQIARTAELHDTNIAQRVEVIVEHFRSTVMGEIYKTLRGSKKKDSSTHTYR